MLQQAGRKRPASGRRRVSAAWPPFAAKLAQVLGALDEDQYLILILKRSNRYLQFFCHGQSGVRVETTSNAYLARSERLDSKQADALIAMGWAAPTAGADESTPENDPDGSPNFYTEFERAAPSGDIADFAVRTFTEVLRVPYPSLLEYQAGDMDGNPLEFPALELRRAAPREETQGKKDPALALLEAVGEITGLPNLGFDQDGDICVRFGSMVAFLRLTGDPANVRILSPLVSEVEESGELLARINEINRGVGHMHLCVEDETIYAVSEIAAAPLVREHVERRLNSFCQIADGLDDLLEAEFGGSKMTDDSMPSSLRH